MTFHNPLEQIVLYALLNESLYNFFEFDKSKINVRGILENINRKMIELGEQQVGLMTIED